METLVTEHDGRLLARVEAPDRVFEVSLDAVEATDVTLRLYRDETQVGSIYNDHGTEKTMARLTVPGESDFIGVEVPKAFVAELLDAAEEAGRVRNPTDADGYRLRMLRDTGD
ncbi:hypothetical protein [Halorientalis marina]|uniref:hypothetical protein n=1 Tax=Halorientalis marina TaxID=2931976 RepID=UPI001FF65CBF|nr:hypothetical protein [Halorientalis marina]